MFRRVTWLASLLLVITACTASSTEETTPSIESATSSIEDVPPPTEPIIGFGRLVVVDEGGDIVILDPDGSDRMPITDDAGETAIYSQPIWSAVGASVAWGQVTPDGFAVGIRAVDDNESTTVETPHLPFYMHWSPDGKRLGILHNGTEALDFAMVDVPSATSTVVDGGSPFYFSWSPDGERVVTHVGSDRFETVKPDGTSAPAGSTSPGYLAPQWTPAGVFHVDDGFLVVDQVDAERRQIVEVGAFTSFVVNPRGTQVAVQSTGGPPAISVSLVDVAAQPVEGIPSEVVVVVDVATGTSEPITERPALGFFWSPNGEALLLMTPSGEGMQATVWGTDGIKTNYEEFRPSVLLVRSMFPFFPQYAQSMSYWSPDSAAFTYAADDGIWVQRLDDDAADKISGGSWVAWSR